jgi:hypothetical protein
MIAVKLQLFINGRYAARATVNLKDYVEDNSEAITHLFKAMLINMDPGTSLEVEVRKREP